MHLQESRTAAAGDGGFSLVEVVVALALIGVVSSAALLAFTGGLRATAELQRDQVAVGLASSALEVARSRPSTDVGDVNPLVVGRTETAVRASWDVTAEGQVPDLAATLPLWDTSGSVAAPVLPLGTTATVGGITYTTTTYVGACYSLRSATGGACTRQGLTTAPPAAATPAGYVRRLRVVAVVRWKPTASGSCGSTSCVYSASTILDPSQDPVWETRDLLIARDDSAVLPLLTGSITLNVLGNDTVQSAQRTVEISRQPAVASGVSVGSTAAGRAGTVSVTADGNVVYARPGSLVTLLTTVTFEYRVRSGSGTPSEPATVTVTIPVA